MTTLKGYWRKLLGQTEVEVAEAAVSTDSAHVDSADVTQIETLDLNIAPNDPFITYCINSKGVINVEKLLLDSPAVTSIRQAGIKLVVPLISQGDLIGLINLGQRLSEQEYTSDDYKLLQDLSSQAAPALKVAQLVLQQKREAAERERIQQELRVARLIQQTLLPKELPQLSGWKVDAYYQPARAVGGDFYDFIYFADGRIAFIVADVTDKGVPAALVMATTRSILRAAAERLISPGAVLERVNDVLHPEIPANMFVTCFYALLDPVSGHLTFANAGHDVPYRFTAGGILELRATGMPLGLMPGMEYEEKETTLAPGEYVLLYSDGLVEAHDPDREMFGFPRLQTLMCDQPDGGELRAYLLTQLSEFTGPNWEQEDDVTLVTFQRTQKEAAPADVWQELSVFEVPSALGNERKAMTQMAEVIAGLPLSESRVERLKTAVAEATMNAMEHGNAYDPAKMVQIVISSKSKALQVRIRDDGGQPVGVGEPVTPDLEAKLAGEQSPRGWGLFLIQNMVDEMNLRQDNDGHIIELVMRFTGEDGE
jgi:serine phosphatase RsbU (regulator of sigma subunit)/anti-sigma regulatory factor (Ser/Thr protein kinase)